MTVTLYSFLMAMLWFSAFVLLGTLVQRCTGVVLCCRPFSLLCLAALTVVRLLLPLELPVVHVVRSWRLYPALLNVLRTPLLGLPGTVLLSVLWSLGALLLGLRLVWRFRRDRRALSALPTVSAPAAQARLTRLLRRRGSARRVALLVSPALTAPLLTGLLHPVILLPPQVAALPSRELDYILLHELTHLTRGDLWVKLLVRLLCCLLWWNPCVYLLQKDLADVLEYQCDLAVTRALSPKERPRYLGIILALLRQQRQVLLPCPEPALLAVGFLGIPEGESVKRRFHLVLHQDQPTQRAPRLFFLAAALALFVCSYSIVLQPAHEPAEMEEFLNISPETAYILAHRDGTYSLVHNGASAFLLHPDMLNYDPHCYLEIVYEAYE